MNASLGVWVSTGVVLGRTMSENSSVSVPEDAQMPKVSFSPSLPAVVRGGRGTIIGFGAGVGVVE